MSDTSDQKMSKNEPLYSAFYTDDNEFCYQDRVSPRVCVNPTKIFTSTFKSIHAKVQQDDVPRDIIDLFHCYLVLNTYFKDPVSKKYIVMLDKSEWKFWFIHVIIQLRKLQTSPQWKQDGELDMDDTLMLRICHLILKHSNDLKLSERSFHVPKEFFQELASCIDVLSPRLPNSDSIQYFVMCASLLVQDSDSNIWKIIEKSGLLVQILRCSTNPIKDMNIIVSFYYQLTKQLSFIQKKFKPGQPCRNIAHKILVGEEGYSNPDPRVLNFLQTISKLAGGTNQDLLLNHPKRLKCNFCNTTVLENLMRDCGKCQMVSYCSKECQRKDWQSHKQNCDQNSGLRRKNCDKYANMVGKFLDDHHDKISAKTKKTMNETGYTIDELMLELNFAADESGIVPALSNPPQFEILNIENFLQTRCTSHLWEDSKSMIRDLKHENLMFCLYHSPFGHHSTSIPIVRRS